MGFDVMNIIGGCLSGLGQGVGRVFKSGDPGIEPLDFFEMFVLEKCKLLLQVSCCLYETLGYVCEMIDIGFCFVMVFCRFSAQYLSKESCIFLLCSSAD